jgi:hypothetical protein
MYDHPMVERREMTKKKDGISGEKYMTKKIFGVIGVHLLSSIR